MNISSLQLYLSYYFYIISCHNLYKTKSTNNRFALKHGLTLQYMSIAPEQRSCKSSTITGRMVRLSPAHNEKSMNVLLSLDPSLHWGHKLLLPCASFTNTSMLTFGQYQHFYIP